MIYLKTEKEFELMREAGKILKQILEEIGKNVKPGVTAAYLDYVAEKKMKELGAKASFKGVECPYRGGKTYSNATCISINDEVIHGIPSGRVLQEGDLVSVDMAVYKNGYHADAGRTFIVGKGSKTAEKLVKVAEMAFFAGVDQAVPGNRIGDISNAIQTVVEKEGFNLLREYQGHGIGKEMHEDPGVPNIGTKGKGVRIEKGMALAIEPMVVEGSPDIVVGKDKWVVKTRDGKLSSYYENTVIITENGPEITTL